MRRRDRIANGDLDPAPSGLVPNRDSTGVGSPGSESDGNASWQRAKAMLKRVRESGEVNWG